MHVAYRLEALMHIKLVICADGMDPHDEEIKNLCSICQL